MSFLCMPLNNVQNLLKIDNVIIIIIIIIIICGSSSSSSSSNTYYFYAVKIWIFFIFPNTNYVLPICRSRLRLNITNYGELSTS